MITINSKSDKRLIVECDVGGKTANFLIDTGASLGLIDDNQRKKYNLIVGRKYNGTVIGAGGELTNPYICNTIVKLKDKSITQFILTDIDNIVDSIKRETGIKILGIIGLPQMKFVGIQIDTNDSMIMLE
jgi:predicted aspartyl protease